MAILVIGRFLPPLSQLLPIPSKNLILALKTKLHSPTPKSCPNTTSDNSNNNSGTSLTPCAAKWTLTSSAIISSALSSTNISRSAWRSRPIRNWRKTRSYTTTWTQRRNRAAYSSMQLKALRWNNWTILPPRQVFYKENNVSPAGLGSFFDPAALHRVPSWTTNLMECHCSICQRFIFCWP